MKPLSTGGAQIVEIERSAEIKKFPTIDIADISAALQLSYEQSRLFYLLLFMPTVSIVKIEEHLGKDANSARVLLHRLRPRLFKHNIRIGNLYGGIYFIYAEDKERARNKINEFRAATPTPIDL